MAEDVTITDPTFEIRYDHGEKIYKLVMTKDDTYVICNLSPSRAMVLYHMLKVFRKDLNHQVR